MVFLDRIRDYVSYLRTVQVVGLLDSSLLLDLQPLYPEVVSLQNQTKLAVQNMNYADFWTVSELCKERYPGQNAELTGINFTPISTEKLLDLVLFQEPTRT